MLMRKRSVILLASLGAVARLVHCGGDDTGNAVLDGGPSNEASLDGSVQDTSVADTSVLDTSVVDTSMERPRHRGRHCATA